MNQDRLLDVIGHARRLLNMLPPSCESEVWDELYRKLFSELPQGDDTLWHDVMKNAPNSWLDSDTIPREWIVNGERDNHRVTVEYVRELERRVILLGGSLERLYDVYSANV